MKIKTWCLVCFVVTLISISCKKESTGQGSANNIFLSQYIDIDTSAGISDTIWIVNYYYDNQKRIDSVVLISRPYSPGNYFREREQRFYNGNSRTPFKSNVIWRKLNGVFENDSHYFYFDNNNMMVKDSIVSFNNTTSTSYVSITSFSNSPDKVIITRKYGYIGYDSSYTRFTKSNGNMLTRRDSVLIVSGSSPLLISVGNYNATYDNKINPIEATQAPLPLYLYRYTYNMQLLRSVNNPISYSQTWYSYSPVTVTPFSLNWQYKYNENDFPVSAIYSNGNYGGKRLYFYTTL
jgi:hypothetical protein